MELPKTRKEATALGLPHYFTGKPCKHGHISKRSTKRMQCIECERDRCHTFRIKHRETYKAGQQSWRDANRNHIASYSSQWGKDNHERRRLNWHRRRARKRNAEGYHTAADIKRITKAQGGRCTCCGEKRKLTIDHKVPLSKGGTDWPDNIQILCGPCNYRKNDKDMTAFMQQRGHLL